MDYNHLGYNEVFLGQPLLPLPNVKASLLAPLIKPPGSEIKYTHFSVLVNNKRFLPLMSAVNIKGEDFTNISRVGNEPWNFSNQIKNQYQIDNKFYANDDNTFDRGHLVRRLDPCWGGRVIAKKAENETFRWVNCTPQHRKLNRNGGVWFQLEQHVLENGVKNKLSDISVFAGPILAKDDRFFIKQYNGKDVAIPAAYWKVIAWKKTDGKMYAVGFMMSQFDLIKSKLKKVATAVPTLVKRPIKDDYFEKLKFKDGKSYQVPVSAIEKATGIKFSSWKKVEFPYDATAFRLVKANKLRKPKPLTLIKEAKDALAARKVTPTAKRMSAQFRRLKPVSKTMVRKLEKSAPSIFVKKYNIKNITL